MAVVNPTPCPCKGHLLGNQTRPVTKAQVAHGWAGSPRSPKMVHRSGRGQQSHPTGGDHRVLEHTAAQLAAQLHRELLGKYQWLLEPEKAGEGRPRGADMVREPSSPPRQGLGCPLRVEAP